MSSLVCLPDGLRGHIGCVAINRRNEKSMTAQMEVLAFAVVALTMLTVIQPVFAVEWLTDEDYQPTEEQPRFRTFTPEEIERDFTKQRENITEITLKEALEMNLQETDPELFQKIATIALLAQTENTTEVLP